MLLLQCHAPHVVAFANAPWFALAILPQPLSTIIFDPYIFVPKDVATKLRAQAEAALYEFMVKHLFFADVATAKAAVEGFMPLYPDAHLKSLLMTEMVQGLPDGPDGEENLGFKDQIYMYDMGPQYGDALPFQRMFLEGTDWRIVQPVRRFAPRALWPKAPGGCDPRGGNSLGISAVSRCASGGLTMLARAIPSTRAASRAPKPILLICSPILQPTDVYSAAPGTARIPRRTQQVREGGIQARGLDERAALVCDDAARDARPPRLLP